MTPPLRMLLRHIHRIARDAGMGPEDIADLSEYVGGCAYHDLTLHRATIVANFLASTGPERALPRLNELRGRRVL